MSELMTVKEAAEYLKVHTSFIYNKKNKVPFVLLGTGQGTKRIEKGALDKYIAERAKSSLCHDEDVEIIFLDWLSSRGEKREYVNGAVYSGYTKDVPDKYKYLLEGKKTRKFCIVRSGEGEQTDG